MDTLYLVMKPENRYIGYVIINKAAVKVMEAQCMQDVEYYVERESYKRYEWRIPRFQLYQMIRTKEW